MKLEEKVIRLIKEIDFGPEHLITTGQQVRVLNHPSLPFVLKFATDPWMQVVIEESYGFCQSRLGGLVASYLMLPVCQAKFNGRPMFSTNVLVQQRAQEYNVEFEQLPLCRKIERTIETIKLDRKLLSRGVSVCDTYHHNFGIVDGNVMVLDVGVATKSPFQDEIQSRISSIYEIGMTGSEAYFLERGFCIHNRAYETSLDDETGEVRRVFEKEFGMPLVPDYSFNLSSNDLKDHVPVCEKMIDKTFEGPLLGQVRSFYAIADDKPKALIILAQRFNEFGGELLNCVHRHKYQKEFIAVGKAEFERFYKADAVGVPIVFPEQLAVRN